MKIVCKVTAFLLKIISFYSLFDDFHIFTDTLLADFHIFTDTFPPLEDCDKCHRRYL